MRAVAGVIRLPTALGGYWVANVSTLIWSTPLHINLLTTRIISKSRGRMIRAKGELVVKSVNLRKDTVPRLDALVAVSATTVGVVVTGLVVVRSEIVVVAATMGGHLRLRTTMATMPTRARTTARTTAIVVTAVVGWAVPVGHGCQQPWKASTVPAD